MNVIIRYFINVFTMVLLLMTSQLAMAWADLSVKKEASPDPVKVGELLTYRITVTNLGPDKASNITVTDNLPFGVTLKSMSMPGGECFTVAGVPICDLESLAMGASTEARIVVIADEKPVGGTLVNTAKVAASDNESEPMHNNRSDIITAVSDGVSPSSSLAGAWIISWQEDEKANGDLEIRLLADGTYAGSYNRSDNGQLHLTLKNNLLTGFWVESESDRACESRYQNGRHWGRVHLQANSDGSVYRGSWGYCKESGPHALTIRRR